MSALADPVGTLPAGMFEVFGVSRYSGKPGWVGWDDGIFYGPLAPDAVALVGRKEQVSNAEQQFEASAAEPLAAYATALAVFSSVLITNGDVPEPEEGDVIDDAVWSGPDEE